MMIELILPSLAIIMAGRIKGCDQPTGAKIYAAIFTGAGAFGLSTLSGLLSTLDASVIGWGYALGFFIWAVPGQPSNYSFTMNRIFGVWWTMKRMTIRSLYALPTFAMLFLYVLCTTYNTNWEIFYSFLPLLLYGVVYYIPSPRCLNFNRIMGHTEWAEHLYSVCWLASMFIYIWRVG